METTEHYVYILECKDGSYYTGYTNDIEKRVNLHQSGKGAKYTRGRTPVELRCYKVYETKSKALKEEYRIKKLSRQKKETFIKENVRRD
jgi:putative endonuclease